VVLLGFGGRARKCSGELSGGGSARQDWWLHVAGHPGSHVVVRSHDNDLPTTMPETLKDAAALAAKNSKAPQRGKVGVSYVRCRQVSKPSGAKAGLVQLAGDVGHLKVDVAAVGDRLARLEAGVAELNSAPM
jgi:hypothetical protein